MKPKCWVYQAEVDLVVGKLERDMSKADNFRGGYGRPLRSVDPRRSVDRIQRQRRPMWQFRAPPTGRRSHRRGSRTGRSSARGLRRPDKLPSRSPTLREASTALRGQRAFRPRGQGRRSAASRPSGRHSKTGSAPCRAGRASGRRSRPGAARSRSGTLQPSSDPDDRRSHRRARTPSWSGWDGGPVAEW